MMTGPTESMHEKTIRVSAERARERERVAKERAQEAIRVAHEMFAELMSHYRVFQSAQDMPRIKESAREWLQRKYPDATVPELIAESHAAEIVFPRIGDFIVDLIRQQDGDLLL